MVISELMVEDKKYLNKLRKALDCSSKVTREVARDGSLLEPTILGKKGKIYTDGKYWYVFLSEARISLVKHSLSFMEVWQEGDTEMVFRLDRMPSKTEAEIIRKIAGLGKKRHLSSEHLQKLIEGGKKFTIKHESK